VQFRSQPGEPLLDLRRHVEAAALPVGRADRGLCG
jgi:hypothetical protein